MKPATARDVVMVRLLAQARVFPELSIQPLDAAALADGDRRDARLAQAVDHAVARHWLSLQAVTQSRLTRPWDSLQPELQAALLAGAAQLLYMDRLPDHAVIDAAVEWTKSALGPGAGGLVNAVLRRIAGLRLEVAGAQVDRSIQLVDFGRHELPLGDGRIRRLAEPVFAEDRLARLAQQTSHPANVLSRWLQTFGEEQAFRLALHSIVQAPIIVSPAAASHEQLAAHDETGFAVFEGDSESLRRLLTEREELIVQDPASAAAVTATSSLQPRLILDLCAGLGTKTRQLARLHPRASIVATDVDEARRATLRQVFSGQERVRIIDPGELRKHDGGALRRGLQGQVDLLVLDVPCSNTGVLARRVEAKYRATDAAVEKLAAVQRQIVVEAAPLLAPSGLLLYATCSIDPAENEAQGAWMEHACRLRIVEQTTRLPRGLPGEPATGYADGGWYCLLRRAE